MNLAVWLTVALVVAGLAPISRLYAGRYRLATPRWWISYSTVLACQLAAMAYTTATYPVLRNFLGRDADRYLAQIEAFANSLSEGAPDWTVADSGKQSLVYVAGTLNFLANDYSAIIPGLAINICAAIASIWIVGDTAARLAVVVSESSPPANSRIRPDRYPLILATLLPSMILWTGQLLRESLTILAVSLTINGLTRRRGDLSSSPIPISLGVLLAFYTRPIVAGALLCAALAGEWDRCTVWVRRSLALLLATATVFLAGTTSESFIPVGTDTAGAIEEYRNATSSSARTGLGTVQISNMFDVARNVPAGVVNVLTRPGLQDLDRAVDVVGVIDTAAWLILLALVWKRRTLVPPFWSKMSWVYVAAVTVAVSVALGDLGQLLRIRLSLFVALLPGVCVGRVHAGRNTYRRTTRGIDSCEAIGTFAESSSGPGEESLFASASWRDSK